MILEQVELHIKSNLTTDFENAFQEAQLIISSMKGFIALDLFKCIEKENTYLLLVKWQTIEDHEIGFRKSAAYQKWKALLHHFYDPFPNVFHYKSVLNIH